MYSHEQLINAVRAAGRDGKTFSVKDVRVQLGFETRDKKELSRFRRRLRAFEKDAGDQLEKVGNNSYRLKPGAFDASEAPKNVAREPASGVFETIQAVEAAAAVPAPAEPHTPSQLTAALQQPAEQAAAVDILKGTAPHAVVAEGATLQLAELSTAPSAAESAPPAEVAPAAPNSVAARVAKPAASNGVLETAVAAFSAPHAATNGSPAKPSAAVASASPRASSHSVSTVQRAVKLATAIVSGALAASAAVSGRVRERSHNLREQLWSCIQAVPTKQHAIARLRGWAENLRPLSGQVRSQLHALRQRVRRA